MIIDKKLIQDLKNAWRNCNCATIDFCQSVPSDKWLNKPFELRFRSFAWEFACLTRVRYCYLKALRTGVFLFNYQEDIPDKDILAKMNKQEVLMRLQNLSKELLLEIEKIKTNYQIQRVIWLLQHERIHQGKLMLYFSNADFKLPKSFVKTWGEANFPKKD